MHGFRHRKRLVAALIALALAPTTRSAPSEAAPVATTSTSAHAEPALTPADGKEADTLTLLLGAVAALVFVSRRSSQP